MKTVSYFSLEIWLTSFTNSKFEVNFELFIKYLISNWAFAINCMSFSLAELHQPPACARERKEKRAPWKIVFSGFLFSLAVLFIFKHLTKRKREKKRRVDDEKKIVCEEIKHEKSTSLASVCTFWDDSRTTVDAACYMFGILKENRHCDELWVILMGFWQVRWAIFHAENDWKDIGNLQLAGSDLRRTCWQ